jgi:MFS transporter, OPA family, glycerol-3-phosphate transporter
MATLSRLAVALPQAPGKPLPQALAWRRLRLQVFAGTWASYFGLYFCRKAFYVVKGDLTTDFGLDAATLANVGVVYLVAYAIGEFNAAYVGSRLGARRLVLSGMALSVACNLAFGFANNAWTFMAFMALNGLAQATGWSGNVGTMAHWFRRAERGQVMGLWSTCYQVGGAAAKAFAAFMLGLLGWRWSFFGASMVLGGIWFVFFALQRNRPEDVGLPPLDDDPPAPGASSPDAAAARLDARLVATILMMGSFYFFVKFIRYALWSWAPYFLQLNFGLAHDRAGYFSTLFDIFGFFGVLFAGFASDRLFAGRRSGLALLMMIGLTLATLVLWLFGAHALVGFGIAYSLAGFMLYGPDSLLSGAGAIDVGSRRHAIVAAGIINGMGSIGAVAQELVVGRLYVSNPRDLAPILVALMLSAGIATFMMALLVRRSRRGLCNV